MHEYGENKSINLGNNSILQVLKLPAIELPKFDGQYSNWLEFKVAFLGLIDNNPQMSGYQKFCYIRQSLSPEVLNPIENLEVTSANYEIAWKKIVDRYESEGLMIFNHVREIYEYSPLQKD